MSEDPPTKVLVLVEHRLVAETVAFTLNHGVYEARTVETLPAAAELLATWQPDLAVVDMDLDGGDVMDRVGLTGPGGRTKIPVLALTRRGDLQTKLDAFERGVDDVMTVPFPPEELLARALVLTRRVVGHQVPIRSTIKLGDIEIDILSREVRAGASVVHLTGLEQSLLYLLAANAGDVVTREQILDALWGSDFIAESNIVDRHVRGLRAKLQNDWRRPRFIATVPGRGYRFLPTFS